MRIESNPAVVKAAQPQTQRPPKPETAENTVAANAGLHWTFRTTFANGAATFDVVKTGVKAPAVSNELPDAAAAKEANAATADNIKADAHQARLAHSHTPEKVYSLIHKGHDD